MNPPIATKARAKSPVSIAARLTREGPPSRSDRARLLRVEPALAFFFRVRSGDPMAELTASPGDPPWERLAEPPSLDGQTIATGAPRSALSRNSVSLAATAAESQGRSAGCPWPSETSIEIVQVLAGDLTPAWHWAWEEGSFKWQCISTIGVVPSNGQPCRPAISYRTTPGVQVSLVADGGGAADLPREARRGRGFPAFFPVAGAAVASRSLAIPKSRP